MAESIYEKVGHRVKRLMLENEMDTDDLARSTGLSKRFIDRILQGTIDITLYQIELLETALKAPILRVEDKKSDFERKLIKTIIGKK